MSGKFQNFVFRVEVEDAFFVSLKSGHKINAGSPPGSGLLLAYILRILDGMLPAPNAALAAHRIVEAFKFGFGERSHLGDHKFVNVTQVCFFYNEYRRISYKRVLIF